MKIILLNNTFARLRTKNDTHYEWVYDYLSVFDEDARHTIRFKRRQWDGYEHFLLSDGSFMIGFVPGLVKEFEKKFNRKVQIVDNRNNISRHLPFDISEQIGNMTLRDYQFKIVKDSLINRIKSIPFTRGIINAATNSGKTLIAAAIYKAIGCRTLFLCPTNEILTQVHEEYSEYMGEKIGLYTPKKVDEQNITIALITTLAARITKKPKDIQKFINGFDCLIVDEAHRSTAQTWAVPILKSNAQYKFALSGTALESSAVRNMKLTGMFGSVVGSITNKELVEKGFSAEPRIFFMDYNDKEDLNNREAILSVINEIEPLQVRKRILDDRGAVDFRLDNKLRELRRLQYELTYKLGIIKNKRRNKAIKKIVISNKDKQILIVVKSLSHGKKLSKELKAPFVSGKDSYDYRNEVLRNFKSGNIRVLISTMIYKEGVSIPAIDTLIYAAGEKAPITVIQFFGRGLRKSEEKLVIDVYDFDDRANKKVKSHAKHRMQIYRAQGFTASKIKVSDI